MCLIIMRRGALLIDLYWPSNEFSLFLYTQVIGECLSLVLVLIVFSFLLNHSEITTEGRRITKLDQILLNGNNIAIVSLNDL